MNITVEEIYKELGYEDPESYKDKLDMYVHTHYSALLSKRDMSKMNGRRTGRTTKILIDTMYYMCTTRDNNKYYYVMCPSRKEAKDLREKLWCMISDLRTTLLSKYDVEILLDFPKKDNIKAITPDCGHLLRGRKNFLIVPDHTIYEDY